MKVIDEGTRTLFARRVRSCAALSNGLSSAWLAMSCAKWREVSADTHLCAADFLCSAAAHLAQN